MSVTSIAKRVQHQWGLLLDRFRGAVPRSVLCDWIARETGGDRFAVSRDPVLIEVGLSQAPLARARALGCDPFDHVGACWLAGYEAVADAKRWTRTLADEGNGRWLDKADRNLWYVCQMDYSVGTRGLGHFLRGAILTAEKAGRIPSDLGLMNEAISFVCSIDLSRPPHRAFIGRQSPEIVVKRFLKHRDWIKAAEKIGPVDGAPPGWDPPDSPPEGVQPFPTALLSAALTCADKSATAEEHARAHADVKAYAIARRRREGAVPPPAMYKIASFLRPHFYRRRVGDLYGVC